MSTPMTPAQWKKQMKKFGVPVEYYKGWETRGRPASKGPFNDVHGIVIHHTGGNLHTDANYTRFLFVTGRSDLPAPLCHAEGRADGTIVIGAAGRANHAGLGSSKSLFAVVTESTPYDKELKPTKSDNSTDGNRHFYGLEIDYGRSHDGPTNEQRQSAIAWAAAICDFHGWTGASVIGHREWTYTKSDPARIKMYEFRTAVDELLKKVNGTVTPVPVPEPDPPVMPEEPDPLMHIVEKGDTLWGLSQKYNTTVADIQYWNNLTNTVIHIGQKLAVRPNTLPSNLPRTYKYPAEVFGKNWKLNYQDKEVKRTKLDKFSIKDYFFLNKDKTGVILRVFHGDKTTSKNTKNPRSEGREMNINGFEEIEWDGTKGEHWMEVTLRVNRFTKKKPHTVIAQIHDGKNDITTFRAEAINSTQYKLWITKGNITHSKLVGTFKRGQTITIKFHVVKGLITFVVNGNKISYIIKAVKNCYFKTGNYLQSNKETAPGESRKEYSEVEIFKVKTFHS